MKGLMKYLMLLFVFLVGCKEEIKLQHLTWRRVDENRTALLDSKNDVLVGPGMIELWGQYPYLYGDLIQNDQYSNFLIDVRTEEKIEERSMTKRESDYFRDTHSEQWVTFQSLRGQHGSERLYRILVESLSGEQHDTYDQKVLIPHAENYEWQQFGNGKSIIVKDGKPIVGPGIISLWGCYPFLYGEVVCGKEGFFFVLDVQTGTLEKDNHSSLNLFRRHGIHDSLNSLFRWEALSGTWHGSDVAWKLFCDSMKGRSAAIDQ